MRFDLSQILVSSGCLKNFCQVRNNQKFIVQPGNGGSNWNKSCSIMLNLEHDVQVKVGFDLCQILVTWVWWEIFVSEETRSSLLITLAKEGIKDVPTCWIWIPWCLGKCLIWVGIVSSQILVSSQKILIGKKQAAVCCAHWKRREELG